jgi:cytochrome c-type biogenesis protein CcmH/NrfF
MPLRLLELRSEGYQIPAFVARYGEMIPHEITPPMNMDTVMMYGQIIPMPILDMEKSK